MTQGKSSIPDNRLQWFTSSVYISAFFIHKNKSSDTALGETTQLALHTVAQSTQYTGDCAHGDS